MEWDKLCKPKALRGLGFRSLSFFNQALVSNHCWIFFQGGENLVAKVLRGKYFLNVYFLSTPTPSFSFYL